jgi:flagellar motor switch/type III secretory pathway protein FliN
MPLESPARPFPWRTLAPVTPASVRALRDVRRWGAARVDLRALNDAIEAVVGAEVDVRVRRAEPVTAARGIADGVAWVVAPADALRLGEGWLIEVEAALAAAVIRRIATPEAAADLDPRGALPEAAAGALAAVLTTALRRARVQEPMRVLAAGPATALEADFVRGVGRAVAARLTALVDREAFDVRVVAAEHGRLDAPGPRWDARVLAGLGALPLRLPVVACTFSAAAAEVASLRAGDVVVPAEWPLTHARAREDWCLEGRVVLAAPAAHHGVAAALVADGRLVLRGETAALPGAPATGAPMDDESDTTDLIEAIGDVPVVVRVEIGEAVMPAREWAALGPGDVVTVGRRLGDAVVLRVGGVPIARGELVDVDGEIGIRIVERMAHEGGNK